MKLFRAEKTILLAGIFIFGIAGLLMLWGSWYTTRETREFLPESLTTAGKVIEFTKEVNKDSDNKKTVSYYPTIEFHTEDNQKIKFKSKIAIDRYKFPVGENINILYNKSKPDNARIDSFDSLWGSSIILALMGAAFLAAALLIYFILYLEIQVDSALFPAAGFAFAVVLLYTGAWWVSRDSVYLIKHGISTAGTVVDFLPAPLVEFQTKEGKTIKYKSRMSSNPPEYSHGESVPVLYDPGEPGRASIDSFEDLWMMTSIMGGLGTVFLFACIFAIYLGIRHRQTP